MERWKIQKDTKGHHQGIKGLVCAAHKVEKKTTTVSIRKAKTLPQTVDGNFNPHGGSNTVKSWKIIGSKNEKHPSARQLLNPETVVPQRLGHLPVDAEHGSTDQQNRRHDQRQGAAVDLWFSNNKGVKNGVNLEIFLRIWADYCYYCCCYYYYYYYYYWPPQTWTVKERFRSGCA